MTYSASIQWLCNHAGILRLHPKPGGVVGDPYDWSATVHRSEGGDSVEVMGVDRPLSKDGLRAVCDALAGAGLRGRAHIRRSPDGTVRAVFKTLAVLLVALLIAPGSAMSSPASGPPHDDTGSRIRTLCEASEDDPVRFERSVLGGAGFWSMQEEVCRSVVKYGQTLVPSGNSVGKSYMAARLILWFLFCHRDSVVFTTGPSQGQLNKVLWGEVRSAIEHSKLPLGIEPKGTAPVMLSLSPRWFAQGHVSNKIENATGYHRKFLLLLIDEGSGVSQSTYEAAWSLNPSHVVVFGNPLHPHGRFYDLCRAADAERDNPLRTSNLIRIPSTASPDIDLDRSEIGLADRGFLERNRRDYGENSIWWLSHILAQFPDVTLETAFPPDWLDLAGRTLYVANPPRAGAGAGFARTAIDVAGGEGGDNHVILTRNDLAVLDLRWSNLWTHEELAVQARESALAHGVHPARVSFDKAGVGWDFGSRLTAVGLGEARPYFGGGKSKTAPNLRSAAARELRYRLDPTRPVMTPGGVLAIQPPFSFRPDRPEWFRMLRPDLAGLLRFLKKEAYALELSEDMRVRLKRSPDFADTLIQSFAFPG